MGIPRKLPSGLVPSTRLEPVGMSGKNQMWTNWVPMNEPAHSSMRPYIRWP